MLERNENGKARRRIQQSMLQKYAVRESYLRGLLDRTGERLYRADDLADVSTHGTETGGKTSSAIDWRHRECWRGSRYSRNPSPMKLKAKTVSAIARPGKMSA